MPLFGGLRGGRKRADGLVPGSPEAAAADRKRDADRKRADRGVAPKPVPAPLPSVLAAAPGQSPAPGGAVGAPLAAPAAVAVDAVPWQPEMIRPTLRELIPILEQCDVAATLEQAEEAGLPRDLVKEIAKDAQWPQVSKASVEMGGSEVAAKWLNQMGISSKNKGEVVLVSGLISIVAARRSIAKRLEKLIEMRREQEKRHEQEQPKPVNG